MYSGRILRCRRLQNDEIKPWYCTRSFARKHVAGRSHVTVRVCWASGVIYDDDDNEVCWQRLISRRLDATTRNTSRRLGFLALPPTFPFRQERKSSFSRFRVRCRLLQLFKVRRGKCERVDDGVSQQGSPLGKASQL